MPYQCPHCGERSASQFSYEEDVVEYHSYSRGIESGDNDEIDSADPSDDGEINDDECNEVDGHEFRHYYCKSCAHDFSEFEECDLDEDDEDEDEEEEEGDDCVVETVPNDLQEQARTALTKINPEGYQFGVAALRDIVEDDVCALPITLTKQVKDALNRGDPSFETVKKLLQKIS